jgi:hypothetical protein
MRTHKVRDPPQTKEKGAFRKIESLNAIRKLSPGRMPQAHVPIAERIRSANKPRDKSAGTSLLSLDEQILALENASDSDDSDSGSDSDSKQSSDSEDMEVMKELDSSGRVVRLVSSLAAERIAPLPARLLPSATCGARSLKPGQLPQDERPVKPKVAKQKTLRFEDDAQDSAKTSSAAVEAGDAENSAKRRRSDHSSVPVSLSSSDARSGSGGAEGHSNLVAGGGPGAGMEAAVRELLRGYQPTSAERRPFWCRICRHQAIDEPSFLEHRESEFHLLATKMEAKASSCQLCRKQFTSPAQLKEHLQAKAHKQRLQYVQERQKDTKKFC